MISATEKYILLIIRGYGGVEKERVQGKIARDKKKTGWEVRFPRDDEADDGDNDNDV